MLIQEFIDRTGFEPTYDEYRKIEEDYYEFDGDKDAFCKAFVENGGEKKVYAERAAEIERLRSNILEMDKQFKDHCAKQEKKIASLQSELDKELEWKPSVGTGTWMSEDRYQHLKSSGKVMSEQEAVEFIADECGFAADKIRIVRSVATYEVNKYRQLRKAASYIREPVYESTDWNYVRFDCASFMYEYENGELRFYCC